MIQHIDSKAKYSLVNYWKECISYAHVLRAFTQRQIKIKYANAAIGVLWAVIQPVIYIALLVILFNKVAGLSTGGKTPVTFASVGMIAWIYFSTVISNLTNTVLSAQDVISKVYFPRIYLPVSVMGEAMIDLFIIMLISVIVGAWTITASFIYFILGLLLLLLFIFALSSLITVWILRFPDVRFLIPLLLRVLIFITPIAYMSDLFTGSLKLLLYINPLVGIIELLRLGIMGVEANVNFIWSACLITLVLLVFSVLTFIRFDRKIGDLI